MYTLLFLPVPTTLMSNSCSLVKLGLLSKSIATTSPVPLFRVTFRNLHSVHVPSGRCTTIRRFPERFATKSKPVTEPDS